jgi:hypothetical protein
MCTLVGMAPDETPPLPSEEEEDSPVSGGVPVPESEEAAKELLEKRMKETEESLDPEHKEGAQYEDRSKDF